MKIKGFDKDLKCRGYQFEVGKTYDTGAKNDEIKLCTDTVFHYCDSLKDVHKYYSCKEDNRYCEIEVLGAEVTNGEKYGSNRIRIVREIVGEELDTLMGRMNGNTGLFNMGNWNTGNWNAGDHNTGNCNTGNRNTGNGNTGNWNTGNWNTGDWNTGDWNTGNWNTGDFNTGMFNKCDCSAGIFCNREEKIRIFNKPSDMTTSEFVRSEYYEALCSAPFMLTEWVEYEEAEMDTSEKRALGGYLEEYTFKEACHNWWDAMMQENRDIIMNMPNFDAEVFKDITGIDVSKEDKHERSSHTERLDRQ